MIRENVRENVKTYRFKIVNSELYEEMIQFANNNKFLNRTDLKEQYEKWIELPNIYNMITEEEELLKRRQYNLEKTNITQKIFKSIKYYHIKNIINGMKLDADTKKSNKKKRTKDICFSKELLTSVKNILTENISKKPSECFELFVTTQEKTLSEEKQRNPSFNDDIAVFDTKLKKMFKNQYYMIHQK